MGKRKLKFDARKNYDRKIRKCSLMVCEVLDVEKLEQVPASAGLMTVPEEQLIVTAPILLHLSRVQHQIYLYCISGYWNQNAFLLHGPPLLHLPV